jgi:hypothetical protein
MLEAGYAEVEITPPRGGSMPGYFHDRQATGVLDPLMAKVLFLREGQERLALVACDLLGIGAPLVARIREAVRQAGVAVSLWVHAMHTHTGGMTPREGTFTSDAEALYPGFFPGVVDEEWVAGLVQRIADAVARAGSEAVPEAEATLHEGREASVAFIRRYRMRDGAVRTNPGRGNPEILEPVKTIDPRLHLLRFPAGRILVVIYGLHPDCTGGTLYSADYPGFLSAALRRSLRDGCPAGGRVWRVLYLNACCGNVNHIDVNNPAQRSGPEEARRIGVTLAQAAAAALEQGEPLGGGRLSVRRTEVTCRLRRPPPEVAAEARERLRTGDHPFGFNELHAPAALVLAETRDREHRAEIAALRVGDFGLAAMPGEIFVELGREVEAASPFSRTRTLGLTNGSMGYIPTRAAFAEGGYEAGYRSARYEPETGHRWAEVAARLLRECGE